MTSDHQAPSVLFVAIAAVSIAAMYFLPRHFDCTDVQPVVLKAALQECYQAVHSPNLCGEIVREAMCKEIP